MKKHKNIPDEQPVSKKKKKKGKAGFTLIILLLILGLLAVYRTTIQSMQNGRAPFAACMIELVMRIIATVGLSGILGYMAVCIASPLAWFGACALLIPCYYKMMKSSVQTAA